MRLLITGTDFGVGKTWVACALARALRDAGKQVVALKPVETGRTSSAAETEDGVRLARATGQAAPTQALVRLAEPLGEVDFDALVLKIERSIDGVEYGVFEGIGGLLTPVTWEWNMTDVARALGAAALVVGSDRRGTVNHTLLTLSVLELAGIHCAGVVLTQPERADSSTGTNAPAITRLSGIDRVLTLPSGSAEQASRSIVPAIAWLGGVATPA
jgi:dethiobiotin synthase